MLPQPTTAAAVQPLPPQKPFDDVISPIHLRNNLQAIDFLRNFVALIVGTACGILGVFGWSGFAFHITAQLLCALPMIIKSKFDAKRHFTSRHVMLFHEVFSQATILTFILFWMILYTICHVY